MTCPLSLPTPSKQINKGTVYNQQIVYKQDVYTNHSRVITGLDKTHVNLKTFHDTNLPGEVASRQVFFFSKIHILNRKLKNEPFLLI